jgi:hypothetical protein
VNIYKSNLFPYITGDSLVNKPITLTMRHVSTEAVVVPNTNKTQEKELLYFEQTPKPLILNKTNAKAIAALYGGETDAWKGQPLELYTERVKAFGQEHNAVRVRAASKEPVLPKLEQAGEQA